MAAHQAQIKAARARVKREELNRLGAKFAVNMQQHKADSSQGQVWHACVDADLCVSVCARMHAAAQYADSAQGHRWGCHAVACMWKRRHPCSSGGTLARSAMFMRWFAHASVAPTIINTPRYTLNPR